MQRERRLAIDPCFCNDRPTRAFPSPPSKGFRRASHRVDSILHMSSVEYHDEEGHLHLFAVDDPRLWEFRSRLSDQDFAIPDLSDEDWDSFHSIIAEA
jgi:hypothetical protein